MPGRRAQHLADHGKLQQARLVARERVGDAADGQLAGLRVRPDNLAAA